MDETDVRRTLHRLDRYAEWLDAKYHIPGTPIRIGVDGLIGLIPGVGDAAGALLSSVVVVEAVKARAGATVVTRMLGNIGLELVVGLVPIVGDSFDILFRSNQRNVRLLRNHMEKRLAPKPERRSTQPWLWVTAALAVVAAIAFTHSWW